MFRFTIRDLLWLMVVVGMGVGWCVDHGRLVVPNRIYTEQAIEIAKQAVEDYKKSEEWRASH